MNADDEEERWEKRADGTAITHPIVEMEVRTMDNDPPQLALRLQYRLEDDRSSPPVQIQLNLGPRSARALADQLLRRAQDAEGRQPPALN